MPMNIQTPRLGPTRHRNKIQFLSFEQIAPVTVSKYCSKFKLIFFASFAGIARKLNILLDYNVDGKHILQSLYIFRCADNVLISRLEELLSNGLFDNKLWFFKLTQEQFHKYVEYCRIFCFTLFFYINCGTRIIEP